MIDILCGPAIQHLLTQLSYDTPMDQNAVALVSDSMQKKNTLNNEYLYDLKQQRDNFV